MASTSLKKPSRCSGYSVEEVPIMPSVDSNTAPRMRGASASASSCRRSTISVMSTSTSGSRVAGSAVA